MSFNDLLDQLLLKEYHEEFMKQLRNIRNGDGVKRQRWISNFTCDVGLDGKHDNGRTFLVLVLHKVLGKSLILESNISNNSRSSCFETYNTSGTFYNDHITFIYLEQDHSRLPDDKTFIFCSPVPYTDNVYTDTTLIDGYADSLRELLDEDLFVSCTVSNEKPME